MGSMKNRMTSRLSRKGKEGRCQCRKEKNGVQTYMPELLLAVTLLPTSQVINSAAGICWTRTNGLQMFGKIQKYESQYSTILKK